MPVATATPPRFVPTLTDVVELPDNAVPLEIGPEVASTLAGIVPVAAAPAMPAAANTPPAPVAAPPSAPPMHVGLEEEVIHRVLHRVDMVLDQRLRKAIGNAVEEQINAVAERLRDEVENIMRHAVYEAVAQELAAGPTTSTQA